jgi:hypothetical protein
MILLQCGEPLFEGTDFIGHRIKVTQAREISQPVAMFEERDSSAVGACASGSTSSPACRPKH